MQLNKNIKIFLNYFLGPLLFIWLGFSIYQQINSQSGLEASWQQIVASFHSSKNIFLLLVVLLMLVNWLLEAWKWKLSVASIASISILKAFEAVLSGIAFSITTPNRVGEYFGRMLYLPEGHRLESISVTLVGSLSQQLATFFSGTIGLIILRNDLINQGLLNPLMYRFVLCGLLAVNVLLTLFYFQVAVIENILERWMPKSKYLYLIQTLRTFNMQLLLRLLLLSFLRYAIFITQYCLLFSLFGVAVTASTVWCVMSVVFLAMAVIPSITLVEVGLRGEVCLQLMGIFTPNSLGIGLTTVSVWFVNLILPAIVGSILILGLKVFKRKDEIA